MLTSTSSQGLQYELENVSVAGRARVIKARRRSSPALQASESARLLWVSSCGWGNRPRAEVRPDMHTHPTGAGCHAGPRKSNITSRRVRYYGAEIPPEHRDSRIYLVTTITSCFIDFQVSELFFSLGVTLWVVPPLDHMTWTGYYTLCGLSTWRGGADMDGIFNASSYPLT